MRKVLVLSPRVRRPAPQPWRRYRCKALAAAPAPGSRPPPLARLPSPEVANWPPLPRRSGGLRRRREVAASSALRTSTSHTAYWKEAATSATTTGSPDAFTGLDPARHGGLETRKRRSRSDGARGLDATSARAGSRWSDLAIARHAINVGTARKRQPEQPSHLVEGLTGRVVNGRAQRLDPQCHVLDQQQT